jgi:predicted phosphodiesterase
MKLLIVGDLHGNAPYFKHVVKAADVAGCSVIVQCGDLGFWPHMHPDYLPHLYQEMAKLDEQRKEVGLNPLWLLWVDGNHENFDALFEPKESLSNPPEDWPEGDSWPRTERGFWRMNDRVCYAPRGHRWEWADTSFLALGGGNSIDKAIRKPHISWWWQELITPRNVADAISGGPVDVMICHDMPDGVPNGPELWIKGQPEDENNRKNVRAVVDATQPKLLFHGHYHYRYESRLNSTKIVGLDCDGSFEKNWTIFDLREHS